jgi:hypothetical protein
MTAVEEIQAAIDKLTELERRWIIDGRNPLFVTLHRTIDAQLAILRDEAKRISSTSRMVNPLPFPILGHRIECVGGSVYDVDLEWYIENRVNAEDRLPVTIRDRVTITESDLNKIDPSLTIWLPIEPSATTIALARAINGTPA